MKVVILGAGVAGLGIGWRLCQRGAEVVVVERGQPGSGATGAAAGMISPTPDRGGLATPEAIFARLSAELWPGFAHELEARSDRKIAFRANGRLVVARTEDEAGGLARLAANFSGKVALLTPQAAITMEPMLAPNLCGALWDSNESHVDNRALCQALAMAFMREGGQLRLNETAIRFRCDEHRVLGVQTALALHEADAFVVATGAWSNLIEGLPPGTLPPIIPVKGEMIALEPAEPDVLPTRSVWGSDAYLVARAGQLIVGATVTRDGFDSSLTASARDGLIALAIALMPRLEKWPVVAHWAGLRPGTPDDLPVLGRTVLENLFMASGQFRNGILFAPAIADAMSACVTGEVSPIDIGAFDPCRFSKSGPDS
ncbi:MAG TPA: glycine oxidase ThiO [Rhizomicrobium sp.]|jgi:glycine oxidase